MKLIDEQNKEDDDISTSIFFREMSHYKDDEEFLELYDPQYHSSHGDDLKVNGNSHFNANESDNIVAQNVIVWLRHLLQKLFWTKPVMQNSLISDLNDEIIQLQRLRSQPAEIKAKCIENNPFSVENSPSSSRKSNKQHFVKFDLEQYYSKLADKNSKPTDSENTVSNSTVERKLQNTTINQTNSHRRCNELLILSASNYFNNFEYDAELDAMLTVLQTLSSRTSLTHHDTHRHTQASRHTHRYGNTDRHTD